MRAFVLEGESLTVKINFKGNHFPKSVILFAVFFYVRYGVSYRDLEEIMAARGVEIDHATLNRWVVRFSPLIAANAQARKRKTAPSWRMDETYIKVRGKWTYLYRAVDRNGKTLDFMLSERRNTAAARSQVHQADYTTNARLQSVQFSCSNVGWDRNREYDPQGPASPNRRPGIQAVRGPRSIIVSREGRSSARRKLCDKTVLFATCHNIAFFLPKIVVNRSDCSLVGRTSATSKMEYLR